MTSEHTHAPIEVVPSDRDDLSAVAAVHIASFPSSFISRIGRDVVESMYAWHLETGTEAALHVARVDGRIVGFVLHGRAFGSIDRFVLRHAAKIVPRIVRHPSHFIGPEQAGRWRQGLTLLRSRLKRPAAEPSSTDGSIGILSIGVDPTVGGRGVGSALMAEVERLAIAKGVRTLRLSVRTENDRGRRFYRKLGWVEVEERPSGGIEMRRELAHPT
jgi:ribosomal protein S18 acetylase RimI-like enzyme